MKRWLILVALLFGTACSSTPTPPPVSTPPPATTFATVVPIPTLFPTVTVSAPTQLPTETIQPTATRQTTTNPKVSRLPAPVPIAPKPPTLFKDGNDIRFTYASVGKLESSQCYMLHVELAVPNLEQGNRGDEFLDTDNCGDQGPAGKELSFVLYRGKYTNSPNYGTILAQTHALSPDARTLNLSWNVRVVQNNGRSADGVHFNTVPLSPNSPVTEIEFQP
jgi:hypothetical protein